MKPDIGSDSQFLPTQPAFDAPLGGGSRRNIAILWYGNISTGTRMARLPDGENFLKIRLFVLTECANVTDKHTDGRTPHDG